MFSLGHKEKRTRMGVGNEAFGRMRWSKAGKGATNGLGRRGSNPGRSSPLHHQTSPTTPPLPGGQEL